MVWVRHLDGPGSPHPHPTSFYTYWESWRNISLSNRYILARCMGWLGNSELARPSFCLAGRGGEADCHSGKQVDAYAAYN